MYIDCWFFLLFFVPSFTCRPTKKNRLPERALRKFIYLSFWSIISTYASSSSCSTTRRAFFFSSYKSSTTNNTRDENYIYCNYFWLYITGFSLPLARFSFSRSLSVFLEIPQNLCSIAPKERPEEEKTANNNNNDDDEKPESRELFEERPSFLRAVRCKQLLLLLTFIFDIFLLQQPLLAPGFAQILAFLLLFSFL